MRLRTRVAVTTIGVGALVVLAMFWIDARTRYGAARDGLVEFTLRHMLADGERARCEADPGWGGRPLRPPHEPDGRGGGRSPERTRRNPGEHVGGAPPVLHAYDATLRARHPAAPRIDGPRDDALWPGSTVTALVEMPWHDGPCAVVLAHGTTNPGWVGGLVPQRPLWLLPLAAVLAALSISLGPVVGRIRRLTRAVHDAAATGFTTQVAIEGRDEVAELAGAFDAATAEVRKQLAAKDEREQALRAFLANTTHDVMIPLTVLKAHLTTIHEQRAAGGGVDLAAIQGAMNEAHYLGALMHNLAAAAKLDAAEPQLTRAPVDLVALVDRVLGRHRPIARQLEVELDGALPDAAVEVEGDVTLLEQAANNLVYNAIRHNRRGGHVGVTLDRVGATGFRLRIVDDGPGIADADLSRLVERGFRGDDARTRAPDGQGLGLNIALRVAEAHDLVLTFARSEYDGLQVDLVGPGRAISQSERTQAEAAPDR